MWSQIFLVACMSVLGLADASHKCPPGVSTHTTVQVWGQRCYQFVIYEEKDFSEAQNYCKTNGGNLAMVKSEEINKFICDTLEITYNIHYQPVWIGLQYSAHGDYYKWVDGSKLGNYSKLVERRAGYNENCVTVIPNKNIWRSYKCETNRYGLFEEFNRKKMFVCEYPAVPDVTTAIPDTNSSNRKSVIVVDDCPKSIARNEYLQVYGSKCLTFKVKDFRNFERAETDCKRAGGLLLKIESFDLDTFIQHELYFTYGLRHTPAWVGLRYSWSHGTHLWLDGTRRHISNFRHSGFKLSEKCVAISGYDGKWLTKNCQYEQFPYVCQFEPARRPYLSTTTPTPSTKKTHPSKSSMTTPTPSVTTPMTIKTTPMPSVTTPMTIKTTPKPSVTTPMTIKTTPTSSVTTPKSITTTVRKFTTALKTTTSTTPTTTSSTAPPTTTAAKTTTHKTTRTTPSPGVKPTCPSIMCSLDCGMDGYMTDRVTGCVKCKCNIRLPKI